MIALCVQLQTFRTARKSYYMTSCCCSWYVSWWHWKAASYRQCGIELILPALASSRAIATKVYTDDMAESFISWFSEQNNKVKTNVIPCLVLIYALWTSQCNEYYTYFTAHSSRKEALLKRNVLSLTVHGKETDTRQLSKWSNCCCSSFSERKQSELSLSLNTITWDTDIGHYHERQQYTYTVTGNIRHKA